MLSDHERRFLLTRRVGHLATADSRAIPHVLPVCFTISQGTALHHHRREAEARGWTSTQARHATSSCNPMVAIVVDRYDEDWTRLGWVMLRGRAEILRAGTEHDRAQELLQLSGTASWRRCRSPNGPNYRGPPGAGERAGATLSAGADRGRP